MKNKRFRKPLAFLLALCLCLGSAGTFSAQAVYAGAYEVPLTNVMENYYGGSQEHVLDHWEDLAAVYAWISDGIYDAGVDLSDYVLPDAGTGSGGLFQALMKGDADAASVLARSLVAGGTIIDPGFISSYAVRILALEAYNRSTGVIPVVYSTSGAIDHLLASRNPQGGYNNGEDPSYDDAGWALAALSLPEFSGYPGISAEIANLTAWIRAGQENSGAYSSYWNSVGSESANSTACVLFGFSASNEDLSTWTTNPAIGLVNSSLYNETDGWSVGSETWNAMATRQAALALAEIETGESFYANICLNAIEHMSLTLQVVKPDGSYVEKRITAPAAASMDDLISQVIDAPVSGGYDCYVDGTLVVEVADGDTIFAVEDAYDGIAYFSLGDSDVGVPRAENPFGRTASFTLHQLTLDGGVDAVLGGIGVDINGDGYSDLTTTTAGAVSCSPISAVTRLDALVTHDGSVALLPAYIDMASGGTQNKTVSVRIEGPTENILYYSAIDVVGSGETRLTAGDAVVQALNHAGKTYTYSDGYLSAVDDIAAGSLNPPAYDGWLYYMNGEPGSGLGNQVIDDDDEIIVYYGYFPGWGTDLVRLETEASGSEVTLRVLNGDTPVEGVSVIWNGTTPSGITDASGIFRLTGVAADTYTVQIAKVDAYGVPQIVRLPAGTTVTLTADGGTSHGGGSGETQTSSIVYLTVKGLRGTTLYSRAEHTYFVGMTARDILDESNLTITGSGNYVSAINGLAEFDHGPGSGWLYMVNGELSGSIAADAYRLEADDNVVWYYTSDYTSDNNVQSSLNELEEEELLPGELPEEAGGGRVFSDIPQGAWYQQAAQDAVRHGLFNGMSDQNFGPDLPMTREMFVTVLGRLHEAGGVAAAGDPAGFGDAAADSYYARYIAWAAENDIVQGMGDDRFGVGAPVTREQMVTFVYRYFRMLGLFETEHMGELERFRDAESVSDWAADAFRWAVGKGLITGRSSDLLDPSGRSSRAEVAMFILRCFNMMYENTV
ncbi:MAG: S-layer homology domain-containing protein [Anaerovoracaceae bacterium]